MRRHLLGALAGIVAALLMAPTAGLRAETKNGIEIIDFGIYSLTVTRRVSAPGDVSLERNIVANVKVLRKDRVIAAQPGRSFGYQFRIVDPALAGQRLTLRTTFPELTNPETGKKSTSQERTIVAQLNAPMYDGYRFDYRWEMAEGIWRFQILADGKLISEQRFKIVVPLN
ncbi:MAG: DUF3859 domain-containing protein [Bauldia litoralis]